MSSSESNSNLSFKFDDDSEYNYIPGIYLDFEKEKGETTGNDWGVDDLSGDHAKTDKPSAEEEWLKEWEQQLAEKN